MDGCVHVAEADTQQGNALKKHRRCRQHPGRMGTNTLWGWKSSKLISELNGESNPLGYPLRGNLKTFSRQLIANKKSNWMSEGLCMGYVEGKSPSYIQSMEDFSWGVDGDGRKDGRTKGWDKWNWETTLIRKEICTKIWPYLGKIGDKGSQISRPPVHQDVMLM